jgi:hypothetical protein
MKVVVDFLLIDIKNDLSMFWIIVSWKLFMEKIKLLENVNDFESLFIFLIWWLFEFTIEHIIHETWFCDLEFMIYMYLLCDNLHEKVSFDRTEINSKGLFLSSCGVYDLHMWPNAFYEMKVGQDKSLWSCLLMLYILNLLNVWYNGYIQVKIKFQIEMIIYM